MLDVVGITVLGLGDILGLSVLSVVCALVALIVALVLSVEKSSFNFNLSALFLVSVDGVFLVLQDFNTSAYAKIGFFGSDFFSQCRFKLFSLISVSVRVLENDFFSQFSGE